MAKKKTVRKKSSKPKRVVKKSGREVNWVLTLIMSIFFGVFGVDRFMIGHVGLGILKLLITIFTLGLLGWVWWLIDIILIATKYQFKGIRWI